MQGYGKNREDYLREKAFSLQTEHKLGSLTFSTEVASDENSMAATASSTLRMPKLNLRLSFRNIEKDFVTITGFPSNRGELGGIVGFDWTPSEKFYLSSDLNIYRDRLLFNPGNRGGVNYEWDTTFNLLLSRTANLSTNIYYLNTPGISSPRRSLRANTTLSNRFDWNFFGRRALSTFLGYNYQRSINPLSPTSDYQLYGLIGGIHVELVNDFYYYFNYRYVWLKEFFSCESDKPSVMETGIDFYHSFTPLFSSSLRFYYRDEERASSLHSFLAGEDSIEGSLHFSYTPRQDAELYFDGRVRNVWAENADVEKYIESEIRMGVRLSWESFFKWALRTILEIVVFKDVNGNGLRDEGEEGIPDIKIVAGPKEAVTDKEGRCSISLRAKKVVVSLEPISIPAGYVLTTPSSLEIDISRGGKKKIQFGISSSSGIFGVVFYDANGDGELDKEDIPISTVKLVLDEKKTVSTNNEGVYFLGNLSPGHHLLQLDVNSLPPEYLPQVPVKKEIEVFEGITHTYHIPLVKK
ncbi:MAG TPA: hypothetical protein EYP78_04855 [Candidatus Omnitrophica bacterium]|nr:hypothetical protein [Candidatus Omnitrophota bacterium]